MLAPTPGAAAGLGLRVGKFPVEDAHQLLVDAGDEKLVCTLLEIEYVRDDFEGGGEIPTWSTLFDERSGMPITRSGTMVRTISVAT